VVYTNVSAVFDELVGRFKERLDRLELIDSRKPSP
jgi:hypothetical protein